MNKELIDKFKTITKKIENPIIKNLLIEMIDTIEEQREKITNLEQENEDLKITKAGQHASIEILKEENESLKGIAVLRKDTLIMNQKKVDKLQERIDKTIKLLKEAGCYEEDTNIFCSDIYQELPELLNILQGEDKDDTNSR